MRSTLRWMDKNLELVLMGFCLCVILIVILVDVIGRELFGRGLIFAQELARYCELYIAFLGISLGVSTNTHIKVDILQTFFPKFQFPLQVTGDALFFVFAVFMAYSGCDKLAAVLASGAKSAVLQVPMFFVYLGLEIGLILGAVRIAEKYMKLFLEHKKAAQ